jgi:hypothetical protein
LARPSKNSASSQPRSAAPKATVYRANIEASIFITKSPSPHPSAHRSNFYVQHPQSN